MKKIVILVFLALLTSCNSAKQKYNLDNKNMLATYPIKDNFVGMIDDQGKAVIYDNTDDIIVSEYELVSMDTQDRNITYCIYQHPYYEGKSFIIGSVLNPNVYELVFGGSEKITVCRYNDNAFFFEVLNTDNVEKKYCLFDKDGEIIENKDTQ